MWIVLQTDNWVKPNTKYEPVLAWCFVMTHQKKGVFDKYSYKELSQIWMWSKSAVKRFFDDLKNQGLITMTGSQITIVNYKDYPTSTSQKKVARKQKVYASKDVRQLPIDNESIAYNVALWIWRTLYRSHPNSKNLRLADIRDWEKEVRLMMDEDKRTKEQIVSVFKFSQDDEFWQKVIISIKGLRRKFDKIQVKYKPVNTTVAKINKMERD